MNIEKERKAFESQNFIKRLLGYSKYNKDRNEYVCFRFEDYAIRDTCELNTAWKAWQASANREGYKLVPVDSLKEIIECAYCHIHDRCVGDEGDNVINHILAMGVEDDH